MNTGLILREANTFMLYSDEDQGKSGESKFAIAIS
jgi:hypothetical protein